MGNKNCSITEFGSSCQTDDCVRFYVEPSFGGDRSTRVSPGEYDEDILGGCPRFRSCKIPNGLMLILYTRKAFGGSTATLRGGFHKNIDLPAMSMKIVNDTAYWCEKNPFDTRCITPTIEDKAKYCSEQTDILRNQNCIQWCQSNQGKCDVALLNACNKRENQQNQLCACFLPSKVYETMSNRLIALGQPPIMRPSCTYARCAQSPMQPAGTVCPNINNVICELNIDNNGTINANDIDLDVTCQLLDDSGQRTADSSVVDNVPHTPSNNSMAPVVVIIVCCVFLVAIVIWYINH